jgi:hypothetical protein
MSYVYTGPEDGLQAMVEGWFSHIQLPHLSQQEVRNRSRVDLMLCLHHDNPKPWCVVELKTRLGTTTSKVKDLADHFEQCVKYHAQTGLPVFLGPFFIPSMGVSGFMAGGKEPRYATAAFSALAGRLNVGLFFIHAEEGYEHDTAYWYGLRMTMRQKTVAQWNKNSDPESSIWPTDGIEMVDYSGAASKSVRG